MIFEFVFLYVGVYAKFQALSYYTSNNCAAGSGLYRISSQQGNNCTALACTANQDGTSIQVLCTDSLPSESELFGTNPYATSLTYSLSDCSGNIDISMSYILNSCIPFNGRTVKVTSSGGNVVQTTYTSTDCSGTGNAFTMATNTCKQVCVGLIQCNGIKKTLVGA
jgi:hypothetical protein